MCPADERPVVACRDSRALYVLLAVLAIALMAAGLGLWRGHTRPSAPTAAWSAPKRFVNPTTPGGHPSAAVPAITPPRATHDPAPPEMPNKFAHVGFPVPVTRRSLQPVGANEGAEARRTDSPTPRVPVGTSPTTVRRLAEESRLMGLPPAAPKVSSSNPAPSASE